MGDESFESDNGIPTLSIFVGDLVAGFSTKSRIVDAEKGDCTDHSFPNLRNVP
jgi:hypothetical protein